MANHAGILIGAAAVLALLAMPAAQADEPATSTLSTLYRFPSGANGRVPRSGVAVDTQGNVYGTTLYDGACGTCGLIYKLTKPATAGGTWKYTVLHKFSNSWKEGIAPISPLTIYKNVLYGTASGGGDLSCGCGTVWRIALNGTGFKVLHIFTRPNTKTGSTPIGGVAFDTAGNLYGTTDAGGIHGAGVLYRITPGGGFTKLHDFTGSQNGGPQGELLVVPGTIYGTQYGGGKYNQGTIFRIGTNGSNFKVLHNFLGTNQPGGSSDGANPEGRLVLFNGMIYGTTTFGGSPSGYGTAWSIKTAGTGYERLRIFGSDGNLPHSGLVKGTGNILYGTGSGGGTWQSGVIYKFQLSGGVWHYSMLYSFKGNSPNGDNPYGKIVFVKGHIYGENESGGHAPTGSCSPIGCGTVFDFEP